MPYSKAKYTPEEIRQKRNALNRSWAQRNPDKNRARFQRYNATAKGSAWRRAYNQEYKRTHPERAKQWAATQRLRDRREYVDAYGGCCACCGETELLFLTLDHVNGDGAEHRRQYQPIFNPNKRDGRTGGQAQKRLIRDLKQAGWPNDGRFRILCWNCQWGVRYPDGCPHQAVTKAA